MLKKFVLFTLLLIPAGIVAQEVKIAYLNSADIITAMPEYTQMQDSLQKSQTAVAEELKIMEDEYGRKYSALMSESETLADPIKTRRLQEIQDIEQRAQNFQQESQQRLRQLQEALFAPIQQKVKTAIEAVGGENNFTYVLEAGTLLYINPQTGVDATGLVKKKLGIN
ncbi:MAG: OmpH family outer membrane protein [Dysgonamonadaceae bacterium]|jgi:outer membrane protein|nr:OmpH family outer membrane protein [Dysgonamonadaceae bacterium]